MSLARHWMAWPEKRLGGAEEPDAELGQGGWGRGRASIQHYSASDASSITPTRTTLVSVRGPPLRVRIIQEGRLHHPPHLAEFAAVWRLPLRDVWLNPRPRQVLDFNAPLSSTVATAPAEVLGSDGLRPVSRSGVGNSSGRP